MKKLITLLLTSMMLIGCTNKEIETSEIKREPSVPPAISVSTLGGMFNDDALAFFSDNYGGITYVTSQLSMIGKEFATGVNLETIEGTTINLEEYKDKNVVLEFVANWCSYCQEESKSHLDKIMKNNPTVEFIQIFIEGDKDEINEFYNIIGKSIPENLTVIPESEVTSQLADYIGLQSFPTILFKDDTNRIGWVHSGLLTSEMSTLVFDFVFGEKRLYNQLKEGKNVEDLTRDYREVKKDLSEDAIQLISDINPDIEAESTIYGNLAKEIIPTDFLDIDKFAHKADELMGKEIIYSFLFATTELEPNTALLKSYEKLKERHPKTTFVSVLLPYSDNKTVKTFVEELDYKIGDIVIDATEGSGLPEFFGIIDLFYVPTVLYQNKENRIAGGLVGTFNEEMFEKGYSTYFNEKPLYQMGRNQESNETTNKEIEKTS